MSNNFIEQIEKQIGQRVDANNFDNNTIITLYGLLVRGMGKSNHEPSDDFVVGVLVREQMTDEYQNRKEGEKMMENMLCSGMSPDDIKTILG